MEGVDKRNLALSMAVVAVGVSATWPFADLPYGDDFAWADVALKLVRTGRFHYNGWEAPMLLAHAYWGALFIRLFGFSFECLRFSTIPFSLATPAVCYLLVRRAGLKPSFALLATLLLGLSPLFIPLAATYMTDVPSLFYTLASLYALARAAEEGSSPFAVAWLALGAALGLIGGTGRQVVWLVPLIVLPYLAWVKRNQTRFALASVAHWIIVVSGVSALNAWFNEQPHIVQSFSVLHEIELVVKRPLGTVDLAARFALMLLFMVLPAAFPLAFSSMIDTLRGSRSKQVFVGALFLALFAAVFARHSLASIPWVPSMLNWEGINGSAPLAGRPIVLTAPVRAVAAMAVYVTACLLMGELLSIRAWARRMRLLLLDPAEDQFALAAMTIFSLAYLVLIFLRGTEIDVFDRYLLPVMPWAATMLLLGFDSENKEFHSIEMKVMPFGWVGLVVFAAYALSSAQDLWSLARARVAATRRLESAGISRTAIDGGMEYNGWTQLLTTGQMNYRWVKNPPGSYQPQFGATPDVAPVYRLEYRPTAETVSSDFDRVVYRSFLPPFLKQVSIDRIVQP